jgi:Glycosyl transferase family 2
MTKCLLENGEGVSFVLTSCGRFDLLERTLASFLQHNTYPISEFIIVEDSGSPEVRDVLKAFPVVFDLIINTQARGQIASIDLAYSRVTQPLIFHCEDDWLFLRSRFIEDALTIVKAFPQISMVNVLCPGILDEMDEILKNCPPIEYGGVKLKIIPPDAHELWFGYSFNPGLRRSSDYHRLGSFTAIGHESDLSLYFKNLNMSIAVLEEPACTHIGAERHVKDSVFPIEKSEGFMRYWRNKNHDLWKR